MNAASLPAGLSRHEAPRPRGFVERGVLTRPWMAVLGLGLYLPIFGNVALGKAFQLAYLLLWTAVILAALVGARIGVSRPVPLEVLYVAIGLQSVVVAMLQGDAFGMLYSVVFLVTVAQVFLLARLVSLQQLLDIGTGALLLALLTCALAHVSDLAMALSAVVGRRGLFRFQPLNNHPNLTGFLFGGAAVLFSRRVVLARRARSRAAWLACAALAVVFVFAASARAALLALALAGLAALWLFRRELRRVLPHAVAGLAVLAIAVLAFGADRVGRYLDRLLEFSSSTRGIGSGGTGRVDLWARGVHALFSDLPRVLFGGGLRSSEFSSIGFNIESSYLTIMLDSGVLLGVCFILAVLALLLSPRAGLDAQDDFTSRCFKVLLVYVAAQSIFNRYFLALGNPLSLFMMCAMTSGFLFHRTHRRPPGPARAPR